MSNFQRKNSTSNAAAGREFELMVKEILVQKGLSLCENFELPIGIANRNKSHKFDLGSNSPPVIVECKSHKWTQGNNVPSAKIATWNEAMFYFHCAPRDYRKLFIALRDMRKSTNESLAEYYMRNHFNLIPADVEIWELDVNTKKMHCLNRVQKR